MNLGVLIGAGAILAIFLATQAEEKKNPVTVVQGKTQGKQFTGTTRLWYHGTSASLDQIWSQQLSGDSVFSAFNPNYFINVTGLAASGKVIFSSSWYQTQVLKEKIQPLSQVKEIQLSLASNPRSVIPSDALSGITIG